MKEFLNRSGIQLLVIIFILFSQYSYSCANIYKYVDNDGQIHLSQSQEDAKYKLWIKEPNNITSPSKVTHSPARKKPLTKIQEISQLKNSLSEKLDQVNKFENEIVLEIKQLTEEIQTVIELNKAKTFDGAMSIKKVSQNMKLIQKETAYLEQLKVLQQNLKNGLDEFIFMERNIKMQDKMETLLADKKYVAKIDEAINKYSPYIKSIEIDDKTLKIEPLENIFKEKFLKPIEEKNKEKIFQILIGSLLLIVFGMLIVRSVLISRR